MRCRSVTRAVLAAGVAVLVGGAAPARAQTADPPRFGPPPSNEPRSTGREVVSTVARPTAATPVTACSFTEPVCVHAAPKVDPPAILDTLRYAEHAFLGYRALGLPPPLPPYDVYLVPSQPAPATVADLIPTSDGWDRASAFTVMPPPGPSAGCTASYAVAQGVAHALALGLDSGAENGALSMASSYLASLVADCEIAELPAIDDFQAHPERSFAAGDPDVPDGALLFPWFLDDTLGVGGPGRVIVGLIANAAQRTPPGSWEFHNEPDIFDVLRNTMRPRGSTLESLLLDFAVARAFVGSRSDGGHLADVERFGDAGRVRFEWAVPFASLPRRLAPLAPIEPTGMTYLWLDLDRRAARRRADPGDRLGATRPLPLVPGEGGQERRRGGPARRGGRLRRDPRGEDAAGPRRARGGDDRGRQRRQRRQEPSLRPRRAAADAARLHGDAGEIDLLFSPRRARTRQSPSSSPSACGPPAW